MDTNAQHLSFPNLAVCKFCAETNDANLTMTVFDSSWPQVTSSGSVSGCLIMQSQLSEPIDGVKKGPVTAGCEGRYMTPWHWRVKR